MNDKAKRLAEAVAALGSPEVGKVLSIGPEFYGAEFDRPLVFPAGNKHALWVRCDDGPGTFAPLTFRLEDPAHQNAIEIPGGSINARIEGLRLDVSHGAAVGYFSALAIRATESDSIHSAMVVSGNEITIDAPNAMPSYGLHLVTPLTGRLPGICAGIVSRNVIRVKRGKVRAIQVTNGQGITIFANRIEDLGEPIGDRKGISLIAASKCAVVKNTVLAADSRCHWTGVRVNGAADSFGIMVPAEDNLVSANTLVVDDVGVLADEGAKNLSVFGNRTTARLPLEVRDGASVVGD